MTAPKASSASRLALRNAKGTPPLSGPSAHALDVVLAGATGPVTRRALALLAASTRLGLRPASVRSWAADCSDTQLAALASSATPVWLRLSRDASKAVRFSTSPGGRAATRAAVAKALVATALVGTERVSQVGGVVGTERVSPDGNGQKALSSTRKVCGRDEAKAAEVGILDGASDAGFGGEHLSEIELGVGSRSDGLAVSAAPSGTEPVSGGGRGSMVAVGTEPVSGGGRGSKVAVGTERVSTLNSTRIVAARTMCTVAGIDFLDGASDGGFRGDRLGEDEMGVRVGSSRLAARRALAAAVELGYFHITQKRKGASSRYVFRLPLAATVEDAALEHIELINLLGDKDALAAAIAADDAVPEAERIELAAATDVVRTARIMLSAGHPAWGYGKTPKGDATQPKGKGSLPGLDHRDFLVLLADAAGVDPTTLSMTERSVRASRRDLKLAGIGPEHPGTLEEQLSAYASTSGARARYDEAWAVRNDARRARAAEVAEHQSTKRSRRASGPVQARVVVDRICSTPMPAAAPGGGVGPDFGPWLVRAQAAMRHTRSGSGDGRKGRAWVGDETPVLAELTARATAAGYAQPDRLAVAVCHVSEASRAVDFVLDQPMPTAVDGNPPAEFGAWLSGARTAVAEVRGSWSGTDDSLAAELAVRAAEAGYGEAGSKRVAQAVLLTRAA
jgi:hypothetical protein